MRARLITVALLLFIAIALPVSAYAGECQAVVVFFDGNQDDLDVINLEATSQTISFAFFQNNGTFVGDTAVSIGARARVRMTAKAVYLTAPFTPDLKDSYVRIRLLSFGSFSASVTHGNLTREPFCVTP